MNSELIEKCNLLAKNNETLIQVLSWDGGTMTLAGSSFYVGLNKEADLEKVKECNKMVKEQTGIFSEFRGHVKMPLICKMAVSEDPQKYFEEVQTIVKQMEQMKKIKWISPEYRVLAAITIHDHVGPAQYQEAVEKVEALYEGMKENHPWLTSGEDAPFAAMLAVSGLDTEALITETEKCYQELGNYFYDKNAVQSLSHVMAVDKTETAEKCRKVEQIWGLLEEKNHKFGTGYELAVLGTLGMLDLPVETIVDEIIEADEYLETQKGFHGLRMGKKERRMYAALMVMDTHMPQTLGGNESVLAGVLAVVIAMEICMIMMMTSTCVAASSH